MDFSEVIKNRHSVRRYLDKPIPRETIEKIVDVARFSPSWKNTQIVRYHVVDNKEVIAKLASKEVTYGFEYNIKTIQGAAAVAVQTFKEGISGFDKDGSFSTKMGDRWQMYDAGISAHAFCAAAFEQGVGTVIQGYFDEDAVKKILDLPLDERVSAIIPMGYPIEEPKASPRKEVEEILEFI